MTAHASDQAGVLLPVSQSGPSKEELEREEYEFFKSSGKAKHWQSRTGSIPLHNIARSMTAMFTTYTKSKHFVWNEDKTKYFFFFFLIFSKKIPQEISSALIWPDLTGFLPVPLNQLLLLPQMGLYQENGRHSSSPVNTGWLLFSRALARSRLPRIRSRWRCRLHCVELKIHFWRSKTQ